MSLPGAKLDISHSSAEEEGEREVIEGIELNDIEASQ